MRRLEKQDAPIGGIMLLMVGFVNLYANYDVILGSVLLTCVVYGMILVGAFLIGRSIKLR